ncbi:MAG: SMP-30/gluconolactonase/LRE family protein [Armatimonadota bacterium]
MSAAPWEVVSAGPDRCGEAPLWDSRAGRLLWTDIPADRVYALDPASGERSVVSRGVSVFGLALHAGGGLVLGGASGLHLLSAGGELRTVLSEHDGTPLPFNDLLAAPDGRIYAGTIYWGDEMERPGSLYLLHPDGRVEAVDDGVELANGLALSPDDRTLYFADSAARTIYAYDVDPGTGRLSGKRRHVLLPVDDGIPDGITTDAEGFLWCACWYGGQVLRFDPDGRLERRIPLPVPQVSSLAFGGPDYTDLYVTTAAEPWPSRLAPRGYDPTAEQGGALYRLRPGVAGRPEYVARFRR